MNPNKPFPKIPTRDMLGYTIIHRYGVFNTNGVYVAEELSLKRFPKPKKINNKLKNK